jgi:hypothetical protein
MLLTAVLLKLGFMEHWCSLTESRKPKGSALWVNSEAYLFILISNVSQGGAGTV